MTSSSPLRWAPCLFGIPAGLIGGGVVVGWALGLPGPELLHPNLRSMAPNAGLALLAASVSVILRAFGRARRLGLGLAALVAVVGLLSWIQAVSGVDLHIDRLLLDVPAPQARMAGATALNVLLLGGALLLAYSHHRRLVEVAVVLALLVASSGVEGVAGLVFRLTYLPASPIAVAVHTLGAFALLGVAVLTLDPRDGPLSVVLDATGGSTFVRRLLPVAVVGRLFLGWLTLVQGRSPGPEAALVGVMTIGVANLLMVTALVFWSARSLLQAQRERDRVQRDLERAEQDARSRSAVAEALRRAATAQEEERRRIARELHDGVGSSMAQLLLELDTWVGRLSPGAERDGLRGVRTRLTEVIGELGRTARGLHPSLLEDLGLAAAVTEHCSAWKKSSGIDLAVAVDLGDRRLPPPVELAGLRIVQEALSNVARHAEAGTVSLVMTANDDTLLVMIEDDGKGFDPEAVREARRLGLRDMHERVVALGGELRIESEPGVGTTIRARLPLGAA